MLNRNAAAAAPQIFSARLRAYRSPSIVEFLRIGFYAFTAWRRRRRERKELNDFLASDHRIAADIGYRHRQQ
ncbi:MAG TPA: hypothetical protein VFN27_04030 [Xanthobacteraceae bacterium]|nr:hypothetical protein [Xanthobacteraceae bacterium]